MFIPVGDTPNPRNFTPWVNWLLIAANVAVYLLITLPLSSQPPNPNDPLLLEYIRQIAPDGISVRNYRALAAQIRDAYDIFVLGYGYKPGAPELIDLFFAMFLHANFLHLAGNMLFLWIYGDNIEHRLGRVGYLLTYLITGVIATLFFALFAGSSMTPMLGASGAISGVLGLYFLLFPRNKVKMFLMLFPFFMDVILLPARLVLGFYLLFDNLLPFLVGSQSGVAYGAHIGGFLAGLGIAWIGEQLAWHWPWSDQVWRSGISSRRKQKVVEYEGDYSMLSEVRSALSEGDPDRAIRAISQLDRQEMTELRPNECVSLADWLDKSGYPIAATRLLRNCLSTHPGSQNLADVYLMLGLMRLRQGQPTSAYQHLLSVFDYNPSLETAERARQALAQINIFRRKH